MTSQIFKTAPPKEILFEFLGISCEKNKNKYEFSKVNFKKALINNTIKPFCNDLCVHYYKSKQFYITRDMSYKHFVTIIRQLCKYHHIAFTSEMKYNKSNYEIVYSIFDEQLTTP